MKSVWYKDAIIYSLDVETFIDSNGDGIGDFVGLTQRLHYLASLGITSKAYHGNTSPLACQKVPVFSNVNSSIRANKPLTDSSGVMPPDVKFVMRV